LSDALRDELKDMFAPRGPKAHPNLPRMATVRHTERLAGLLRRQLALPHSQLVAGGDVDAADMYVAPTVVAGVRDTDPLMEEELFGPVLSLVEVADVDDAVARVNARPHPLASYVFASPTVAKRFVDGTRSGATIVNDVSYHLVLPELPFGGVGESGIGAYHGKEGFLSMTQPRPVMRRNKGMEAANAPRYPNNVDKPFMVNFVRNIVMAGPRPRLVIVFAKLINKWGPLAATAAIAFYFGKRFSKL
ncbi:Aldehyde dehydrogenase, partial [Cladochytrium tenue]